MHIDPGPPDDLFTWSPPATAERDFAAFDRANPRIWKLFERFTLERVDHGFCHYSADAIMHRVRWETPARGDDSSGFKINNNHVAQYARKFARLHPEHGEFFRFRERRRELANA